MARLAGKVVVVTGGAGLLGRSFVRAIAAEQGIAVLADLDAQGGAQAAAEIQAAVPAGQVCFEPLDITARASIRALLTRVKERFGRIDAVVNSAYPRSRNYGRRFEEVEYQDFCSAMSLHLGGYFLVSQQFAEFFREQGHGNVVSIASIYGVIAPRFQIYAGTQMTMPVEYAVIKSGLLHLNRYMMRYFQGHPIRFNCISPGGILDGQPERFLEQYAVHTQTRGMLAPQDITGALLFLLSDESRFVNGQNLVVDDGFST
jgi:NAD(P)-dependent dehydrogenase (short-subunit alcohol dehydrogenase family)